MKSKYTCILMTGMPHSGTRLPVQMLSLHPEVSVGMHSLNYVKEFLPLAQFFFQSMDATPLHSASYRFDRKEFAFIMDAYMSVFSEKCPYCLIKMPYYPLNFLNEFSDYFDGNIRFVFTRRPAHKIVKSFITRGEDKLFFSNNMPETFRQIKFMSPKDRGEHLVNVNAERIFHAQTKRCEQLRAAWDDEHPENPFVVIEVDRLAKPESQEYIVNCLDQIGLARTSVDEIMSTIDADRLRGVKTKGRLPERLKTLSRDIMPPVVWRLLARMRYGR